MRRRLFQGLQQRVERAFGKHVDFVNQIDLVAAARWRVLGVVNHLAHVVHTSVRRRINLQQVHEAAFVHLLAGGAFSAGIGADAGIAVEALGNDARQCGLAHAARAGQQNRRMQLVHRQCMRQRLDHVRLAQHVLKTAWPVFAGESEITHTSGVMREG